MKRKNHLIAGFGINDSTTPVCKTVMGRKVWCPIYVKWRTMLTRCYGKSSNKGAYKGCTVAPEWKYFSTFREWVLLHKGFENLDLDKDILFKGNTQYSPDTCVFVPTYINRLLVDKAAVRGDYPIGVSVSNRYAEKGMVNKAYRADVKVLGASYYLGNFNTSSEAHRAWQIGKIIAILAALDEYEKSEVFNKAVQEKMLDRAVLLYWNWYKNRTTVKL